MEGEKEKGENEGDNEGDKKEKIKDEKIHSSQNNIVILTCSKNDNDLLIDLASASLLPTGCKGYKRSV